MELEVHGAPVSIRRVLYSDSQGSNPLFLEKLCGLGRYLLFVFIYFTSLTVTGVINVAQGFAVQRFLSKHFSSISNSYGTVNMQLQKECCHA